MVDVSPTSLGDRVQALEAQVARLSARLRLLTIAFAVFVVLHALLIPLLPTLFAHALQASVGALVLGCVGLALVVTKRLRAN